jgi:hypothetical protein
MEGLKGVAVPPGPLSVGAGEFPVGKMKFTEDLGLQDDIPIINNMIVIEINPHLNFMSTSPGALLIL